MMGQMGSMKGMMPGMGMPGMRNPFGRKWCSITQFLD
jgi:hypothetical protein